MTAAFIAFVLAASLLIIAPGPDSLLVVRNTMARGRLGGTVTAAGTLTGLSLWAVAAVFGLSALLQASRIGYDVLCVAGAAYLIWLGVASLRAPAPQAGPDGAQPAGRLAGMYVAGLLTDLVNPKIGIFFVAFLPGFVPDTASFGPTIAVFGALFVLETGLWLVVLSWLVRRGAGWLNRPRVGQVIQRLTGALLIGFGIRLAAETR